MTWTWVAASTGALLAGVSVTLQLGGTVALDGMGGGSQMLRAIYINQGLLLFGSFWLAAVSVAVPGDPPKRPRRVWYALGGVVTVPAFISVPAGEVLGLQVVLMLYLVGMISAALLLDHGGGGAGRLPFGRARCAGLACFLLGVVLELLDAVPRAQHAGSPAELALYVVGCITVGCLYAVQSKMNAQLARDLGSSLRSAIWCNTSAFATGGLLLLYLREEWVEYESRPPGHMWVWLLLGLQSAFYTLAMTLLPKVLAYSSMFALVLAGKLGSSALADALGTFQPAVPLSALRGASVCAMFAGAGLYTLVAPAGAAQSAAGGGAGGKGLSQSLLSPPDVEGSEAAAAPGGQV